MPFSSSLSVIWGVVMNREDELRMEQGGGSGKRPLEEVADGAAAALEAKKHWKNPLQVQILEDAYAVTTKPSASMKEDLAWKTGLDYKQVQYWFGNRRYLDRHGPKMCRTRFGSDEMLEHKRYGRYRELSLESALNFNSIPVVYPSEEASLVPSLGRGETSISWSNSRLLKFPEHIEPHLHQSPVISQHLLSPKMMQPHPFTLSFEEMPLEIQRIVKHVEKRLGQPLRPDEPILGVEFSPLPPGAFEAPNANKKASEYCNGQVIQRSDGKNKDLTFFNKSGCTFLSSSCNGKAAVCERVHKRCADAFSSPTHQHLNYPPQSSKDENNERNRHVCLANAVGSSKPSNCLCVDSNNSSEGQQSSAIYEKHEVAHVKIHLESRTINAPNSTYLVTLPGNNIHDGNPCRIQNLQVFPSGSPAVHSIAAPHGQKASSPKTAFCGNLRNLAGPGAGASHLAEGSGEHQDFTLIVSSEVEKCCDHNMGNQSTSNLPFGLTSWHADQHFFVRPRKRSGSRGCMIMNYFSDHSSTTTLVAEWKENERRAAYFVVDIEINSSDSSGTNSIHSEEFKDHATVNVVCSTIGLTDYDNEGNDAGKNLHGNNGMPFNYNNEENGRDQMDKNYKDEVYNDDIMTSPVSSEKTI